MLRTKVIYSRIREFRVKERALEQIRILVVDDMPTVRTILRGMLAEHGFRSVDEAEDAESAMEMIRKNVNSKATDSPYDLVIADLNMPGMSGVDLLRMIRAEPSLTKLRFVMVTAKSGQAVLTEAWGAGVDDYVVKPFSAEDLAGRVKTVLGCSP